MQLYADETDFVPMWVEGAIGIKIAAPRWAVGCIEDGALIGGAVFSGFTGANLDITLYSQRALSRRTICGAFAYAWGLGAIRVTARTRVSNLTMRDMLRRLGFAEEAYCADYYGREDDALQFRLLKADSRWVRHATGRPRPRKDGASTG